MLCALLRGFSSREYREVLPQMAATAGVSRGAIGRQAVEAGVEQRQQSKERRWDRAGILLIDIDGLRSAEHRILSAVGVDTEGKEHIPGIGPGATEGSTAVRRLLTGQGFALISVESR